MSTTISALTAASTIDGSADYFPIDTASLNTTQKINRNTFLGISSAPLGTTDTQSPTNKTFDNTNTLTIKDANLTIQNSSSTTKQAKFSSASITAGQTRTFTLPDLSDTLVTLTASQTLTNKTLTSPTISAPTITNATLSADAITGFSASTTGTIYGMSVSAGILASAALNNTVNTAALQAGSITSTKIGTDSSWSYTSWTPTLTNMSKGNGTITSTYIQVGKTVFAHFLFTLGSTSTVGTSPTVSLPVTAVSGYSTSKTHIGVCQLQAGGVGYFGPARIASTTTFDFPVWNASSTYLQVTGVTATVPGTWANNDFISASITYEAA